MTADANNVVVEPFDVNQRLESLGLNEAFLRNAVTQGYLVRTRLTENHPQNSWGYCMWAETVASLRDQLRVVGWEKSNEGSYELTVNLDRNVAIAVATGDEGTGSIHAVPSNKCPKGSNTIEAINVNNRIDDMFADLIPAVSFDKYASATWILLYHIATEEVRCELSLPWEIGIDGKIRGWKERIILRSIPLDGEPIEIHPPQGPDIDIAIKRRA